MLLAHRRFNAITLIAAIILLCSCSENIDSVFYAESTMTADSDFSFIGQFPSVEQAAVYIGVDLPDGVNVPKGAAEITKYRSVYILKSDVPFSTDSPKYGIVTNYTDGTSVMPNFFTSDEPHQSFFALLLKSENTSDADIDEAVEAVTIKSESRLIETLTSDKNCEEISLYVREAFADNNNGMYISSAIRKCEKGICIISLKCRNHTDIVNFKDMLCREIFI